MAFLKPRKISFYILMIQPAESRMDIGLMLHKVQPAKIYDIESTLALKQAITIAFEKFRSLLKNFVTHVFLGPKQYVVFALYLITRNFVGNSIFSTSKLPYTILYLI